MAAGGGGDGGGDFGNEVRLDDGEGGHLFASGEKGGVC